MNQQPSQSRPLPSLYRLATASPPVYPLQLLIVDRPMGPAAVLADTLARVVGSRIAITVVEDHMDALDAAINCGFDAALVGVEADPLQLTIVPHLHMRAPDLPVLVVGRHLSEAQAEHARLFGARDALTLPQRAVDLRRLAGRLVARYSTTAARAC